MNAAKNNPFYFLLRPWKHIENYKIHCKVRRHQDSAIGKAREGCILIGVGEDGSAIVLLACAFLPNGVTIRLSSEWTSLLSQDLNNRGLLGRPFFSHKYSFIC
jgi:hypothetical protein